MELIKTKKLKSLKISKNYSLSGNDKIINIHSDSDTKLSIESLSAIRRLSNLDTIKPISEYYPEIKILNITGSLNYASLLGAKKSKEYGQYLKDIIKDSFNLLTHYHTEIFPIRKRCYENLNQIKLIDKILDVPQYNHAGVTGRTSITNGFNFLTMKKEKRSNLKSLDKEKILVEVDFKSCEPFFYLKSNGFDLNGIRDVYTWISKNYNVKITSREKFKRGILSMLYGANEYTIAKVMQTELKVVKKIKQDLGIDNLFEKLDKEYDSKNFILNYYGRPITSNNNLVNYWIQSSAVDFCSLAFYDFFKTQNVKPCFFIHDSMTFEIEKERVDMLENIKEIKENKSNISIPVEFNVLNA